MKTNEQIIKEIYDAMQVNKNTRAKCNTALSDAISLIQHTERVVQDQLTEEYRRGINDAWEIARELCKTRYDECSEIFGDSSIEYVIKEFNPFRVKEKIESYRKEKGEKKKEEIIVGNIVIDKGKGIKATVLELDHTDDSFCVYTQNGDIEYWLQDDIENTGVFVDVNSALIK